MLYSGIAIFIKSLRSLQITCSLYLQKENIFSVLLCFVCFWLLFVFQFQVNAIYQLFYKRRPIEGENRADFCSSSLELFSIPSYYYPLQLQAQRAEPLKNFTGKISFHLSYKPDNGFLFFAHKSTQFNFPSSWNFLK